MAGAYVKTLIPGAHPVPALMCTTSEAAVLLPQLLDRGWGPYGARLPDELVISPDRLQLVVDQHVLLDGVNPATPAGWWSAVDRLDSCCVVIITADGDIDLPTPGPGTSWPP